MSDHADKAQIVGGSTSPASPVRETPIPNSSWKGCGHPVMLNTNHCEVCAPSGEMTAEEFYDMNLGVPKFHPADKAQVFTFADRVSAHNTAALRGQLQECRSGLSSLNRSNGQLVSELAQLRKDYFSTE